MIASWSFPYCDLWMLVPTDLTPVLALHICRANTGVYNSSNAMLNQRTSVYVYFIFVFWLKFKYIDHSAFDC